MTNTELKAQIDADITNSTTVNSVTTLDVGGNMKDIVDYVDQEVNKSIVVFKITQSGTSNPTISVKRNKTNLTWTASRTGVGAYRITPSATISTDVNFKLFFNSASYTNPNYVVDNLGLFFDITIKYWNGSTFVASDDVVNNAFVEIEIF